MVAKLIYEYQDVFSKGLTDMGQTRLVKHTIDTEDTPLFGYCRSGFPSPSKR